MAGFAQGPWTVRQSRNGINQFNASGDTWIDASSFGTLATLPWIVLENTFGGVTRQVLLSCVFTGNNYAQARAWVSEATLFPASVGGAQPVAPADAIRWIGDINNNDGWFVDSAAGAHVMHVMQSWDAVQGVESLRMTCLRAGANAGGCFIEKPTNIPSGGTATWPHPIIASWMGRGSSYPYTWDRLSDQANGAIQANVGSNRWYVVLTAECTANSPPLPFYATGVNTLSGGVHLSTLGVCGRTQGALGDNYATPPIQGSMGRLADFWLGCNSFSSGTTYPVNAAAPELAQWTHMVWPWDPTVGAPLLT